MWKDAVTRASTASSSARTLTHSYTATSSTWGTKNWSSRWTSCASPQRLQICRKPIEEAAAIFQRRPSRRLSPARPDRMMTTLDCSPLGKAADYPDRYDPARLFPIERAAQREAIGLRGVLPFGGVDLWTAYEITWLDAHGK